MIAVLLSILKIIGIVLLCILAVMIFILLLILFWPITYKGRAVRTEKDGDPPFSCEIRAVWLMGFLNAYAGWPGDPNVRVRICMHELFRMPEDDTKGDKKSRGKKKKDKKNKKIAEDEKAKENENVIDNDNVKETDNIKENDKVKENDKENDKENIQDTCASEIKTEYNADQRSVHREENKDHRSEQREEENKDHRSEHSTEDNTAYSEHKKKDISSKIRSFFNSIGYTLRKIYDKINGIYEKTCDIREDIKYYYDILVSDMFKDTFTRCKKRIIRILHQLIPRYFNADIIEGTGDPASTAKVLAVCGMMYPVIGEKIKVTGDFDDTTIKANVDFHGRITVFVIVWCGLRIYFDKDLRKLLKMLKKEE